MNPARPTPAPPFVRSAHCRLLVHCLACRTDARWRASIVHVGLATAPEWECPRGYTAEIQPVPAAQAYAVAMEPLRQEVMPCCGKAKRKS